MTTQDHDQRVQLYDTTLRDGTQGEGVNFTPADKVQIAHELDQLGFEYVEGGYPAGNERDMQFFELMRQNPLKHAKLSAFGMTMRASSSSPESDDLLQSLIQCEAPAYTIVGKTWKLHVREALRITEERNLELIRDSIAYCKKHADEVIFDAEHFFDAYRDDPTYARAVLQAAVDGGADWLVLCDTNGGTLHDHVGDIVGTLVNEYNVPIGIHPHNDSGLGVAITLDAVRAGAKMVQGTVNGLGERCGNANIITAAANLALKLDRAVLHPAGLRKLTHMSRLVSELMNVPHPNGLPYVGSSAFAHKGGMHVSAVARNPETYEHIDPALIGNQRRILLSDLSGRSNVRAKFEELGINLDEADEHIASILAKIKQLEADGYEYEAADASFDLLVRRSVGEELDFFDLEEFRVVDVHRANGFKETEAMVHVRVGDHTEESVAKGNGPVNALDTALRQSVRKFFPVIKEVKLLDYKVRVLSSDSGTDARVRVLIESGDGEDIWTTVGVSSDVVAASYHALIESLQYKLMKERTGVKA